jgi:FKBP-type peptidyl-prolyl cis-trans isomerase
LRRAFLLAGLVAAVILPACGSSDNPTGPSSLVVDDLVVGTGATAVAGDRLTVNYVGTLTNGQKFDSSYDRGTPFVFTLGAGAVIAGWDQGLVGMRVGGKRRLTIPPNLGYGNQQVGPIPANSTLIFEVELVSIAGK